VQAVFSTEKKGVRNNVTLWMNTTQLSFVIKGKWDQWTCNL